MVTRGRGSRVAPNNHCGIQARIPRTIDYSTFPNFERFSLIIRMDRAPNSNRRLSRSGTACSSGDLDPRDHGRHRMNGG